MNLEQLKNQTILLLGKPRAFSQEEFLEQINVHNISVTKELSEAGEYVLEGRMMTPYEQHLSDDLYEKGGYTFLSIDDFEKLLAEEIDDDVLLMSLKLSNDKERLKSFLQNGCIPDSLFFKLLGMYSWGKEDFFENDDNRDVTAALIGRFYENIERNHNVQYATTGLIHLVSQTDNAELLEAISKLEPLAKHPKLTILLAQHPKTPKQVLKKFLRSGDRDVMEAIARNSAIDSAIVKELSRDETYATILAQNINLSEAYFELLEAFSEALALNETLSSEMQKRLLALNQESIKESLAKNRAATQETLSLLAKDANSSLKEALLQNPNIDKAYLQKAFDACVMHTAIAKNPALPSDIAQELFETGDSAVLDALSRNEATPVDILYQLQLDSRFERAVKTNAAFGKHIQSENIGWLI